MLKKAILFLLVMISFLQFTCAVSVSAKSAVLLEASSGKIVYEKDAYTRRGIASTTKVMTALVTLDHANLDDIVTVKQSCTGIEGSSMYLQPGEELSVRDLLYGLLLQSGNDCAAVLADYICGDQEVFVDMMNQKALELNLKDTHFSNPSGLPSETHYSTAFDMARLTVYAMKDPVFQEIVSTRSQRVGKRFLQNHNRLLSMCEGVDGVKTGFTKSSGRCLISSAVRNETRLVAVTLAAPDDWQDHAALYDYGFSKVRNVCLLSSGTVIKSLSVVGGTTNSVDIIAEGDLQVLVDPSTAKNLSVTYYLPHFLYAPVVDGSVVGKALITENGKVLGEISLLTADSVSAPEPTGLRRFFVRIFS